MMQQANSSALGSRCLHGLLVFRPPCRHVYNVRDGPCCQLLRAHARVRRPPGTVACAAARRAGRFWRGRCRKLTLTPPRARGRAERAHRVPPAGPRCATGRARNQCALVRRGWPLARAWGRLVSAGDAGRGHDGLRRRLMPFGAMRAPAWLGFACAALPSMQMQPAL